MYMASGSSTFSPILNAVIGVDGEISTSTWGKRLVEVAGDQRPDLLCLPVVGLVVAAGQRIGADDDAPFTSAPKPASRVMAITCSALATPSSPTRNPYRMASNFAKLEEHSAGKIK
jgi:hypothetical protein